MYGKCEEVVSVDVMWDDIFIVDFSCVFIHRRAGQCTLSEVLVKAVSWGHLQACNVIMSGEVSRCLGRE